MERTDSGAASSKRAADGLALADYYQAGARWLAQHAARLDALNVFPVPDGDTGTNMRLTLEAAVQAMARQPSADAGAAAALAAEAALFGARGNSGVILSQVLAGVAAALRGHVTVQPADAARALDEAVRFAYRAVANPVEGTLLTTLRDVAAAVQATDRSHPSWSVVLDAARRAARESVAHSPDLLPKLREAGVVDAGAEGLAVILDGMGRQASGESLEETGELAMVYPNTVAIHASGHALDEHGYCTNFVVRSDGGELERLRADVQALGTSAVVAAAGRLIKVHIHTERPGLALEAGARYGELTAIEIANMRDQVAERERPEARLLGTADIPATASVPTPSLVAVVPSPELARLFAALGARSVPGGQTMNPSVGDLLAAVTATNAEHVFILPNNRNVILAAQEAARRWNGRATVIPSTTIPQGVAAAVAYLADRDLDENCRAMTAALTTVTTIEVALASRASVMDGKAVCAGQAFAAVDGKLTAVADDAEAAALDAIAQVYRPEHTLLTVYTGQDTPTSKAEALTAAVQARMPDAQIEVVVGGQPHYPYILALE